MYPWLVFLHVLAVFGFLMAHGVSISVAFALHNERNLERIRTMLNLSSNSLLLMQSSILIFLVTGITLGFKGHWWGHGWIWLSLGVLIATFAYMYFAGTTYFGKIRELIGLMPIDDQPNDPANLAKIGALLSQSRPAYLAVVGFGSLALITWLMLFKPF